MRKSDKNHSLLLFFLLSYLFTWVYSVHGALLSHRIISFRLPAVFSYIAAYGPAIAASVMALVYTGKQGLKDIWMRLLMWRAKPAWYLIALLGQPVIWLIAMGIGALVRGQALGLYSPAIYRYGAVPPGTSPLIALAPYFALQFVSILGEEAGWRGYALPKLLSRHNWLTASVILFVGWALWHGPLFFIQGSAQSDLPIALYLGDMLVTTLLMTWIYMNTKGSLLLATLFHASINTSTLFLPVVPSIVGDGTVFYIGLGIKWALSAVIVILNLPKRLGKYPQAS